MKKIEKIYFDLIEKGVYDENNAKGLMITEDEMIHGVCIQFSKLLITELRKEGYSAGLIATDAGKVKHAAVIYKDKDNQVYIADPVTDIKILTEAENRKIEVKKIIKNKNWKRDLKSYYDEYGVISEFFYDEKKDSINSVPLPGRLYLKDREQIEAHISLGNLIVKNTEPIQNPTLNSLKHLADGPTLLACQELYKRGISTYCSNYTKENGKCFINIDFNSLSLENKELIRDLIKKKPDNYVLKCKTGFYRELGGDSDVENPNIPMEVVLGFKQSDNSNLGQTNIDMFELINSLKKQTYMQGVYSYNDVMNNEHNKIEKRDNTPEVEELKCNDSHSNFEIAQLEGLLYSEKYNMFFSSQSDKSRYIESLYRKENDWRTEEEIANENNLYFAKDDLFYESIEEYEMARIREITSEEYENESIGEITTEEYEMASIREITSEEIEEASVSYGLIDKLKGFFKRSK